jgi:hypothetical protein
MLREINQIECKMQCPHLNWELSIDDETMVCFENMVKIQEGLFTATRFVSDVSCLDVKPPHQYLS